MNQATVTLPILGTEDVEELPVEMIDHHYRLVASPGMVEGLAAGDEFILDSNIDLGFRIVKHSGNLCVWFYFPVSLSPQSMRDHPMSHEVEALGGRLDGGGREHAVYTIAVRVGFPVVEKLFAKWLASISGSTWMFGNVYDPHDGETPLDWWMPK